METSRFPRYLLQHWGREAEAFLALMPDCPKMPGYEFLYSRVPSGHTTINSLKQEIPSACGYFSSTCFQGKNLGVVLTAFLHNSFSQPQTVILNESISYTTQKDICHCRRHLPEEMVSLHLSFQLYLLFKEP